MRPCTVGRNILSPCGWQRTMQAPLCNFSLEAQSLEAVIDRPDFQLRPLTRKKPYAKVSYDAIPRLAVSIIVHGKTPGPKISWNAALSKESTGGKENGP